MQYRYRLGSPPMPLCRCKCLAARKCDYARPNFGFTLAAAVLSAHYSNPLCVPLVAQGHPLRRPAASCGPQSRPKCALRFKFCRGTNCLANRIFTAPRRRTIASHDQKPASSPYSFSLCRFVPSSGPQFPGNPIARLSETVCSAAS